MPGSESGTKVPTFNLKSILDCKQGLASRLALFANRRADAVHLHMLADAICLISKKYTRAAVVETLRPLAGGILTPDMLSLLAARVAGNGDTLATGRPISLVYTAAPRSVDNAILYISRVQLVKDRFGKYLHQLSLDSLSGDSAGVSFEWAVTRPAANVVASRVGFSAPWDKYAFLDPAQLSGIYMYAVVGGSDYSSEPTVKEILDVPALIKYNRASVLKLRCRVGETCPNRLANPCHMCALGRDRCRAAVHKLSYVYGNCLICNTRNAIFDPEASTTMCITCERRNRLKTEEQNQ